MAGNTVISDDEDEVAVEEEIIDDEQYGERVDGRDENEEEEEEEEDEEGQDEYEKDGFIVDDVEEEEGEEGDRADSDEERQKKEKWKKRDSERNYVLDEDDYELLLVSNISVPRPKLESNKFKRLKKARRDIEEGSSGFSDEEEFDGNGAGGSTAEEKLKRSLFGDDDGQPLEDIADEDEQLEEEEDVDIGEEDEMADFIADEEEVDEHGAPVRKKKPK